MKKITFLLFFGLFFSNSCTVVDPELIELVREIKDQNVALLDQIKSLQAKSDSLINELKKSDAKQTELIQRVTNLQGELAKVLTQINAVNQQLQKQGADLVAVNTKLADLQKKYEEILSQLTQLQKLSQILLEIETLKKQLTDLNNKYQVVATTLGQNQQALDALKTQITALQTQMTQNLTRINQLTTQLGEQGVDIDKVLAEIDALKKNSEELKAKIDQILKGLSPVPTIGLVGWWPFIGNANDGSDNKLNGVVVGARLTTDRNGQLNQAYEFLPTSTHKINIDLRSKFPTGISNEYSFLMWVRPNRAVTAVNESTLCNGAVSVPMANSNQNWAFTPPIGTNTTLGVGVSIGTNGIFVANHAGNLLISRASIARQLNGFQCIVVSQKSNVMTVYVNGKLERTITNYCVNSEKKIGELIELGGNLFSSNFSGVIDDFAIWNRILTADEITKVYNEARF
jgi:uncharacterized coiled-coil DUF342 family protein